LTVGGKVRQAMCRLQTFDNFLTKPKMLSAIFLRGFFLVKDGLSAWPRPLSYN